MTDTMYGLKSMCLTDFELRIGKNNCPPFKGLIFALLGQITGVVHVAAQNPGDPLVVPGLGANQIAQICPRFSKGFVISVFGESLINIILTKLNSLSNTGTSDCSFFHIGIQC